MNGVIYRAVLETAPEPDIEIRVTKEVNGFGVFLTMQNAGWPLWTELLKWFPDNQRDKAIEWGVQEAIAQSVVGPKIQEARIRGNVERMEAQNA